MTSIISKNRAALLTCIASIGITGCSIFGINNVEEAAHSIAIADGDYELRNYEPVVVATTEVNADFDEAGKIAFRRLFGYISGNNVAREEISMTSPVLSESDDSANGEKIQMTAPVLGEPTAAGWTYSFVLPSSYTIETAPQPLLNEVTLAAIPEKQVAVLKYKGLQSESKMQDNLRKLEEWIGSNNLAPASAPRWAGYNPPFTIPFLRRNEVMIDVE